MLQLHQIRVVDEKEELDGRISKLQAFFSTPIFASLDEKEKDRLTRQHAHMDAYSGVLEERIRAFTR